MTSNLRLFFLVIKAYKLVQMSQSIKAFSQLTKIYLSTVSEFNFTEITNSTFTLLLSGQTLWHTSA